MAEPALQRASTAMARGLYPWTAGSGAPMIGVPLGKALRGLEGGAVTVCADPISLFERARLISNPSAFILGLPGLGKSALVKRIIAVSAAWGVFAQVSDIKGEYVDLITGLGGQAIPLGRGRGALNVLDIGEAVGAASRIGPAGAALLADARARRQTGVEALITVQRGHEPTEHECLLLAVALSELDKSLTVNGADEPIGTFGVNAPVFGDLLHLIEHPTEPLQDAALWRGDLERYYTATDPLRTSLSALSSEAGLGAVFGRPTTTPMRRDVPVVFDLSGIDKGERKLQAAALLSSWAAVFGAIGVSHALADAGLEPARRKLIVADELWLALRAGVGLVDRYDALSRLNRADGVGTIQVSHTMSDLEALESPADRAKAAGLVERAGMLFLGGLPRSEMPRIQSVMRFTEREQDELVSWSTPPTWQMIPGRVRRPPGQGKFLMKVGGRPGIPFRVTLTDAERSVFDTDQEWNIA